MFVHTVFFWCKKGTPPSAIERLEGDCRELLARVATVRQLWAGVPAGTPRDVVDNTYDVGLTVVFDDRAGHDVYQADPLHQQFIARHKAIWQRIVVHDFE
jgi:hypothetical protein